MHVSAILMEYNCSSAIFHVWLIFKHLQCSNPIFSPVCVFLCVCACLSEPGGWEGGSDGWAVNKDQACPEGSRKQGAVYGLV